MHFYSKLLLFLLEMICIMFFLVGSHMPMFRLKLLSFMFEIRNIWCLWSRGSDYYRFHHVAGGLKVHIDQVKSGSSSRRGSLNKENINSEKVEMPKLSVEPLHMKRKKRGGGCNLRKSLAWDRAFSTEEGNVFYSNYFYVSMKKNMLYTSGDWYHEETTSFFLVRCFESNWTFSA